MNSLDKHRHHYKTHSKEELIEAIAHLHVANEGMAIANLHRSKTAEVSLEVRALPFGDRPDSGWMKTAHDGFRQAAVDNAKALLDGLTAPWQLRAIHTSPSGVVTELEIGPHEPVDFNNDVTLEPVVISPGRSSYPVRVSFDAAEGQGRVWLMDSADNWVAIEGPAHARTLAGLLTAWADAYTGEEKP